MNVKNQLVPRQKEEFSAFIAKEGTQKTIMNALNDKASAQRLTSTLVSAVASNPQLRQCKSETILASALRGEGMGLIYGLTYYLVPYNDICTFQMGYKAYIQLAITTGLYSDIDCLEVREGELAGRDKRTGKRLVDLSVYETDEERLSHPVIGYYAYFILKDGTFRCEYWPMEKILEHADHYSKAFDLEKFRKLQNNELSDSEAASLLGGSPWYDAGGGQVKMAKKTVLKSLLTSGFAPLSNEVKYQFRFDSSDETPKFEGMPIFSTDNTPRIGNEAAEPDSDALPSAATAGPANQSADSFDAANEQTKPKRGRSAKKAETDDDVFNQFFGETE